jgi:UDP-N-acetylglucosamine 4-epimerase
MKYNQYHQGNLSNYSFLVTGGAGFIGSNIVEYLVQYGAKEIRILDNLSTGYLANIEAFLSLPNVQFIEGDIRDYKTCQAAVNGIDFVSHQAALGSVPRSINDPLTTNDVNISGHLNMLNAAREAGVQRMVYAASSSTYGDSPTLPKKEEVTGNPLSPYAVTKLVNELYAGVFSRIYQFHTIGLRYFNVFGPKQNLNGPYAAVIPVFINNYLSNQAPLINGDGETSRDFTFISNVVQANIKSLLVNSLTQHEVINVACNQQTSLNSLAKQIAQVLESDILPTYQDERTGDVKHSLADYSKASKLIGYNPDILFSDGLLQTISYFANQKLATSKVDH